MTSLKRLYYTFRMFLIRSGSGRAHYLAKKIVFRKIGENVVIQPRLIPLYSELISIGNNVMVAKDVLFVTHDVTHRILNKIGDYSSRKCCY